MLWPPARVAASLTLKPAWTVETVTLSTLTMSRDISSVAKAGSLVSKPSTAPFSGPRRTW